MSGDVLTRDIASEIAAKKAKLEALKAKRIARQQQAAAEGEDESPPAAAAATAPPAASDSAPPSADVSFADASLDISNGHGDAGASGELDHSGALATAGELSDGRSPDDSVATDGDAESGSIPDPSGGALDASGATSSPASSSLIGALSPPQLVRGYSRMRQSMTDSRAQSSEQLQAIKQSLTEIATHSLQAPPPETEQLEVVRASARKRMSIIGGPGVNLLAHSVSQEHAAANAQANAAREKAMALTPVVPEDAETTPDAAAASSTPAVETPDADAEAAPSASSAPSTGATTPAGTEAADIAESSATPAAAIEPIGSSDMSVANGAAPSSLEESQALIDELVAQVSVLSDSIRSKNEDLAMAGDLGTLLMQHNEEAAAKIDELQRALETADSTVLGLKDALRAADRRTKKLGAHLHELQHVELAELSSENEIVKMELELERNNHRLMEVELRRLQQQQQKERVERETHSGMEESAEMETLRAAAARADALLAESRRANEALEEALTQAREEAQQARKEAARLARFESRAAELSAEVATLKQAADTVNLLAELTWENQRLDGAVAELSNQLDHMHQASEHDQELLAALQAKIEALERQLQEEKVGGQRAPKAFESLADDEVLEEAASPTHSRAASTLSTPAPAAAGTAVTATAAAAAGIAAAAAAPPAHATPSAALPPIHPAPAVRVAGASSSAVAEASSRPHSRHASGVAAGAAANGDDALAAEQELLSAARLAAESALTSTAPHSSLESGSASLAYASAAAFSPARRAMHISSAGSPSLSGVRPHRPSGSGGGASLKGFLGSLLPGSGPSAAAAASTASPSVGSASRLTFTPTSSHPLAGGGALRMADSPSEALSPPSHVWDESELGDESQSRPPRYSTRGRFSLARQPGERDADHEFFALTLLCVKIHCGRKMESLYTLSTADLWRKAKEEQIQFHQYYSWLESEVTKAYVSNLANAQGATAMRDADGREVAGMLHAHSFLPSNSAVPATARSRAASSATAAAGSSPTAPTLNTAAARAQLQTPGATAPALAATLHAAQAPGAASTVSAMASPSPVAQSPPPSRGLASSFPHISMTPSRSPPLRPMPDAATAAQIAQRPLI